MKLIRFIPSGKLISKESYPQQGKSLIPKWYKEGEKEYADGDQTHPGMKSCIPFLDVLISGYFLVTPVDLFVGVDDNGDPIVKWNSPSEWSSFIGARQDAHGATIPRPAGHHTKPLVWQTNYGWKTPRGWSVLVSHPHNRYDLPFTTLSGIIDSDRYESWGNIPFFLKEGFTGVIPAGTPYAQLIPIKRKKWKSIINFARINQSMKEGDETSLNPHYYKRFRWVKKHYE